MQVAIYARILPAEYSQDIDSLLEELTLKGIGVVIYKGLLEQFEDIARRFTGIGIFSDGSNLNSDIDCLISLGGDGTILDTVTLVGDKNIPILGVNFGRLGFLTGASREEFSLVLGELINQNYIIDSRTLIHLDAAIPLFGSTPFALNDFTITKRDAAPMIVVRTFLNGEFINSYYADGLIVATATGSTGYSMSCSGPIIFPDSASLVITPIAPHHLNTRPIIVPDNNVISFEVESRASDFLCTLDARREVVANSVQLAIRRESFTIKLIRFKENSFLSTLRSKLSWGFDKRN
ncbi:NAD kinase [Arachidicoccus ginsenosidivorans]|jgi:NAD+ kinase|uniref:NAD kinase n=1 Tax=Arachidicoccus ginsenosidivorans TaxID=496057 RepID=A0A5B8VLE7_9BACT|nr:NAD kinase [Arachidicoccus ginsenosidivorans]QEC72159.1 NAD kinase [Arachidicoccus ginsenosidivorans]